MISSLNGIVDAIGNDWVSIVVNGVGFQVHTPSSTLSTLGAVGARAKLYTRLIVREDSLALFGFKSTDELSLFETLLTATGVGPKLALSMLSAMDADSLATAIVTGNTDLLVTIPGVGKKTASRLILELKDKIGDGWVRTVPLESVRENADVMTALVSLGYSQAEAARAVATIPTNGKLSLEEKLRQALAYFSSK